MKEFWKNEWQFFLDDMQTLGEFFLQPVIFSNKTLQLQSSVEEREDQVETRNTGIWGSLKQGCANAKDFLMQPVKFD